jgi:hypothetical protein
MTVPDPRWVGGWEGLAAAQREAWRGVTADDRLRWLEDALDFAAAAGALDRDRRRRARRAAILAAALSLGADSPPGSR